MLPLSQSYRLTVAICTYNRADLLRQTLLTLVETTRSIPWAWEVLVIDNNSQDQTPQVAQQFAQQLPLRYVFESTQGLSYARNRAMNEAKADFIVFTDDDVKVMPGWLEAYESIVHRYPDVAFVGGRIQPLWQSTPPEWVVRFAPTWLNGVVVWCDCGEDEHVFDIFRDYLYGANFGFRVAYLREIGGFNVMLGRKEQQLLGGEDLQAVETLARKGYLGVYSPHAVVLHRIEPKRWSRRFIFNSSVMHGKLSHMSRIYKSNIRLGLLLMKLGIRIGYTTLKYCYGEVSRNPDRWLTNLCRLGWAVGEWSEVRAARKHQHQIAYA